jgi:hypothetical protein
VEDGREHGPTPDRCHWQTRADYQVPLRTGPYLVRK